MAIPIARVHLKMAHATLPGLLPTPPPKCVAAILPGSPLPKRSRADAAERWDAHKIKPHGNSASSSSSCVASGQHSSIGSSPAGRASSCERWDSNEKQSVASSLAGRTSSLGSSGSRADSEERWDAHKKPVSPASPPPSSASSDKWRPKSRASNSMEIWDAYKKPNKEQRVDEHDDGESSTASNDMEVDVQVPPPEFFAGPGFIASPEPSMLPMPSFMIRVA